MTAQSMRERVSWRVQDPTATERVGRVLLGVLALADVVTSLGADAASYGSGRARFTIPTDPEAFVDIGVVELSGRAAWLTRPGRHRVAATSQCAYLVPPRGERPTQRLPLEDLTTAAAEPTHRTRHPRRAQTPWRLDLREAGQTSPELRLTGAWLALAWIGHLAAWPGPR